MTLSNTEKLLQIMHRLRDRSHGCPWDVEQTFESLTAHTLEEAYEVADCIERGDTQNLRDELGDLLFQVVFYAEIADEHAEFDFEAVAGAINDKLLRRHPHVFGTDSISDASEQTARWEAMKATERQAASTGNVSELDDVPLALPALIRANKMQKRAARVGFDWPDISGVEAKVHEELREVHAAIESGERVAIEDEIGDLIFACVNWARFLDIDPERSLRKATRKFERRFRDIELQLASEGRRVKECDIDELERRWLAAKQKFASG